MQSKSRTRVIGAKRLGRSMTLRAVERVVPEHFNSARGLMVPRCWQIEVMDGLPCEYEETAFVAMAPSSSQAEDGLVGSLTAAGLSGTVRIKREAKAA